MEILDLRSRPLRLAERIWRRPPGPGVRPLARLAADLVHLAARCRNAARGAPPTGVLVVSVGNLALGGTGKTPVVRQLALDLAGRGRRGAVLTRGYGSRAAGPLVVDAGDAAAGDESRLLAAALAGTGWTVVQARRRGRGLARLLALEPAPEIIVVEDGHQTAGVPRHLDVLILDDWRVQDSTDRPRLEPRTGLVFPFGPYREDARGAGRADVWLVESDHPPDGARAAAGAAVLGFRRRATVAGDIPQPYAVVAGIAHPERFEADAAALAGAPPRLAVRLDDHSRYTGDRVAQILAAGRRAGVAGWLTTEKDWVKLSGRWPAEVPMVPVVLEVAWTSQEALPDVIEERLPVGRRNPR
ncbi:MAG: tetraacyldisaccharide 4'-kinase [Candidatus Krumholzibacteriia bacterium]